jgi:antirestriction protein
LKIPRSLSDPKVAKLSSQTLRVLRKLCEGKEKIAKLSYEMLRGLHELCEALKSDECEIRDCEEFVLNAPRRTRTLRSSQL